uniref:Uncharacterized protein n=1 Tax=Tetranychus urticae TaxID=32264 RepID=T1KTJ8_TETUR
MYSSNYKLVDLIQQKNIHLVSNHWFYASSSTKRFNS